MRWLAEHHDRELTAVAIAPDLGERYLDTIYQANWLQDSYGENVLKELYGENVLSSDKLTARSA
jgi:cysteine synthase A